MAKINYDARRCGNTTRQVDEWIQMLFTKNEVYINDHAQRVGNHASEFAEKVFLRRLDIEHNLKAGKNSQLKKVSEFRYELSPF